MRLESIEPAEASPQEDAGRTAQTSAGHAHMADMPASGNSTATRALRPLTYLLSLPDSVKVKLKIGISLLLFASLFLLGKFDLSKSWAAAKNADLRFLVLAAMLFLLSTFLNAHRWRLLAAAVDLDRPYLQMAQYCFVGLFFNLFCPLPLAAMSVVAITCRRALIIIKRHSIR